MTTNCLMIGGPYDGQFQQVASEQGVNPQTIQLPMTRAAPLGTQPGELATGQIDVFIYNLEFIQVGSQLFPFYRVSTITVEQAIERLFRGYKRP